MFSSHFDQLFSLISSLDKAEKRNFKLYSKRIASEKQLKFIQLFDVMDGLKDYDEELILKKLKLKNKGQLSNLKRHLYSQILKSLRLIHSQKKIDIQIREQIDFAKILYGKALYSQAIKILDRAKQVAQQNHQNLLKLEIIEFEKQIELTHATLNRGIKSLDQLIDQSENASNSVLRSADFQNFKLGLQSIYIEYGPSRNEKDAYLLESLFNSRKPKFQVSELGIKEQIYFLQSKVWLHYANLNYALAYKNAVSWLKLSQKHPEIINSEPELILKAYHYILNCLYYLNRSDKFQNYLNGLYLFYKMNHTGFHKNTSLLYFYYSSNARINQYLLEGHSDNYRLLIELIEREIASNQKRLDDHRMTVLRYKLAWLNMFNDEYESAIDHLNILRQKPAKELRKDIHAFSELLHLICHLELGHFDLADHLILSVEALMNKYQFSGKSTELIFSLIKNMIRNRALVKYDEIRKIKIHLQEIESNKFEHRLFNYFHFKEWIESKTSTKSISQIVQLASRR